MRKLQFLNPVGLVSDNFSTVRIGSKWAIRTVEEEDRSLLLVDGTGASQGTARVIGCWTGELSALPAILIETCNDPVMRTWSGVAQILSGLHPDEDVGFSTTVTVLQLKHTGSIIKL